MFCFVFRTRLGLFCLYRIGIRVCLDIRSDGLFLYLEMRWEGGIFEFGFWFYLEKICWFGEFT